MSRIFPLAFLFLLSLLSGPFAWAQTVLLDEDWQGYADGGELQSPWRIGGVGDRLAGGGQDLDAVTVTGGWAVLENVGNEKGNLNPTISRELALGGRALQEVSFQYRLERDYTDASQIFFSLGDGKGNAIALVLGKNYQFGGMTVRGQDRAFTELGHRFSPGEIVTVRLMQIDPAKKTFALAWQSSTGTSGQKADLPFSNPAVASLAVISFGESSMELSKSRLAVRAIKVLASDAPVAPPAPAAAQAAVPNQPLPPESWRPRAPERVSVTVVPADKQSPAAARIDLKAGVGDWQILDGPELVLEPRSRFARNRSLKVVCDLRTEGLEGFAVQIRVKQGTALNNMSYTRSISPRCTWEGAVEVGNAEHCRRLTHCEGAVAIPNTAARAVLELRVVNAKPAKPATLWLSNVQAHDEFTIGHLVNPEPKVVSNIFFADRGAMNVEFVDADTLTACRVELRDEEDRPLGTVSGGPKTAKLQAPLPAKGYYALRAVAEYEGGKSIVAESAAAVVGESLPDEVRRQSRFGVMRVHGSGDLWKKSGANWDWGPGTIRLQAFERTADGTIRPPADWKPLTDPPDYDRLSAFANSLPSWLYDSPRGEGLFPPKDWNELERLLEAFAMANPGLSRITPFNEPNAHWRGNTEDFVKMHQVIRAGLKKGNPALKVDGPCLYSIAMPEFKKLDEMGLLKGFDAINMHAYVNATAPEGEFIERVAALTGYLRQTGRGDWPLYLTEFGWCSGHGDWQKTIPSLEKARYCARSLALVASQPVDGIVYFCFQIVGLDATEGYSLLRPDGLPTPSYVSYVTIAKWLATTRRHDGHWFRFSPDLNLVLFESQPEPVAVAWCASGPGAVKLPVAPTRLEDMMGRPVAPPADGLLAVSPSPIYMVLPAGKDFANMARLPERSLAPGASLTLPWPGRFAAAEIALDGNRATVAPTAAPGEYLVLGEQDGKWQAQPLKVVPPLTLGSIDFQAAADGSSLSTVAKLTTALEGGAEVLLRVTLEDGSKTESKVRLVQGQETAVAAAIPGFALGKRCRGRIAIELQGQVPWRHERPLDQTILGCPIVAETETGGVVWDGIASVDISDWGPWPKPVPPGDCVAQIRTAAGAKGFHLLVEVTDDVHRQDQSAPGMWQEDSLQVAFDVDAGQPWRPNDVGHGFNGHRIFQYGVALPGKGGQPLVWRWRADAPDFKAQCGEPRVGVQIRRDGTRTTYDVFLPWDTLALGQAPAAGSELGFSVLVNDRDTEGGRHALRIFGGIMPDQNPENLGRLRLLGAAR